MLFIPLPFVNALLLALIFARLERRDPHPGLRPFLLLIGLCCLQSVLLGLRWGYGIAEARLAIPVVAALLPPVLLECFHSLRDPSRSGLSAGRRRMITGLAAVVLMAGLAALAPSLVDGALVLEFLGYALALGLLALRGPDDLGLARLDRAAGAHRALWLAAGCLVLSAGFDVLVLVDFELSGGKHAAVLVGNANLVSLLMIGVAALAAGRSRTPRAETPLAMEAPSAEDRPSPADADTFARVDALMRDQQIFRDENLTLARLSRRAGLPARQVSRAINAITGHNVSRYVNGYRIKDACRHLGDPALSVSEAMFRSGFSTKSNFNREFLRVTGKTPDGWRRDGGSDPD